MHTRQGQLATKHKEKDTSCYPVSQSPENPTVLNGDCLSILVVSIKATALLMELTSSTMVAEAHSRDDQYFHTAVLHSVGLYTKAGDIKHRCCFPDILVAK